MTKKNVLIGILLATILLGIAPAASLAAPEQQDSPNLLRNPGFEADWSEESSHLYHTFPNNITAVTGNIFTPPGWVTWFRHQPGTWDQPEVTDAWDYVDARRVHSGQKGIRLFSFYRDHDAGFYQVVSGLEAGATVQFSAYGQGWSCSTENPTFTSCVDDPWAMVFQVGIEPNGIINPDAPSVVWSPAIASYDVYSLIGPVSAQVGEGGTVVVFLRSITKWAAKHQDSYWDDASLTVTSPGVPPTNTPPPPPPPPTDGPSPTPRPTPTPRPDGAIVHVVQAGDTLFGISLMYDVPLDQIRQLNAGSVSGDIINVGQELVISLPSETPTPPPAPTEEPAQVAEGNPGSTTGASICVAAFKDRNGDGLRNGDEELLPNATIKVVNADGVIVNQHTTDGLNEPHCFTGLAAGSYRIIQEPPPDYTSSGQAEQVAAVAEGTSVQLSFGSVRGDEAGGDATPTQTSEGEGGAGGSILPTLFSIAGVLMLLLAGGMAVLFVLNRRRM